MPFALRSTFLSAVLLFLIVFPVWAGSGATVTAMTQNMDAGTDLGFALAYLNTSTPEVGVALTYQEILRSNFEGRAAILAREIAATKPDIVSLQEVTTWITLKRADYSLNSIVCDQLQLLLAALGDDYSVARAGTTEAVNFLAQIALPMDNELLLGLQDRDVVLVRKGVTVTSVAPRIFQNILIIPVGSSQIQVPQGWMEVEASVNGNAFTLVDTHLQTAFPGQPLTLDLQSAQALELATALTGKERVVVAGDFNSNATHTPPERTPAVGIVLATGFTDTWAAVHHGNPGFTWPLYLEDPLHAYPNGPFERIDFILERGLGIKSVERVGWKAPHASDHAGVLAELVF